MKQLLFVAIVMAITSPVFGQAKNKGLIGSAVETGDSGYYGMGGCGLGSVFFGETESRLGQILAATTNGIYSNDTFAMSSGTSNCTPEKSASTAQVRKNVDMFVAANRESLANDIAKSNGETIVAISDIMGCKDAEYLGTKLQSRYENIFAAKEDQAIANNVFNTVTSDRYLIENCKI